MLTWGIGTASIEEITWVIIGFIAFQYNVREYLNAQYDLADVLASRRNGRYERRAKQLRRNEFLRAAMQGGLVLIGVIALFLPPPEAVSILSRVLLWSLQWGLVYGAWRDSEDREWLRLQDPGPAKRLEAYMGGPPDEWHDPLEEFRGGNSGPGSPDAEGVNR